MNRCRSPLGKGFAKVAAKVSAARGVIAPVTRGRPLVRSIRASMSRSTYMLMALAPPAASVPPITVVIMSQTEGTPLAAIAALGMVQFGALALPGIGAIIAVGAGVLVGGMLGRMTGRFAANLIDSGYRKEEVENLAARLQSGHPALVLEVKEPLKSLPLLRDELASYRAELVEQMTVKSAG